MSTSLNNPRSSHLTRRDVMMFFQPPITMILKPESFLQIPTKKILRRAGVKSIAYPHKLVGNLIARAGTSSDPQAKQFFLESLHILCFADPKTCQATARRLPDIIGLVPYEMKNTFRELLLKLSEASNISGYLPLIASNPRLGGIVDEDLYKACKTPMPAVRTPAQERAALAFAS